MAFRDSWHRALVYFGLAEERDPYEEEEPAYEPEAELEDRYRERPNVRRLGSRRRRNDFASGLTYALDGGMQRIADKVFMLTPRNVQISAEERAQLIEKGFFNQS